MYAILALSLTTTPAAAQTYASEVQDVEIAQETLLLEEVYETGYLPSGSPLAVNFGIEANQTAWVEMLGEADMTWPEALSLGWQGIEETGWIQLFTELNLVTSIQYDIAGYTGEYEIDARAMSAESEAIFDPFLLPGGEPEFVTLSHSGELDSIDVSYSPVSVIEIVVSVTASLTSDTSLQGVRVDNEGADSIESDGATVLIDVPDASAADVYSEWIGLWDTSLSLTLTPAVEICIDLVLYTTCETLAEFDQDIELTDSQFEEAFDPVNTLFPLPWMSVAPTAYDFGEQRVETTENLPLEVGNNGQLELTGEAALSGDDAFEVWPEYLYAPAESFDGLIVSFTPLEPGEYNATVTLTTNDPRLPTVDVTVTGVGYEEAEPDPGSSDDTGDAKLDTIGGEVTCGCTARPSGALAFPVVLFGLLVSLRRREPGPA